MNVSLSVRRLSFRVPSQEISPLTCRLGKNLNRRLYLPRQFWPGVDHRLQFNANGSVVHLIMHPIGNGAFAKSCICKALQFLFRVPLGVFLQEPKQPFLPRSRGFLSLCVSQYPSITTGFVQACVQDKTSEIREETSRDLLCPLKTFRIRAKR